MDITYFGVAIAAGLVAFSVASGVSKIASSAFESMARQPEVADKIRSAMGLPIFLVEGAGMLCLIIFFMLIVMT